VSNLSAEADRRKLRQIASIAELLGACWALNDDDIGSARRHRDLAVAHGAGEGALPERAHLAGLDLALALAAQDTTATKSAMERLILDGTGYGERSFVELLHKLEALAPDELKNRLRELSTS
jgi:hypothetical protein